MSKTTIKTISILFFFAFATVATACKKDNGSSSSGKTSTFTIDGVSFSGKTSTQTFVNNNYSILCEQDSPYELLQITFHNQADAEAGGTFNVSSGTVINVASGEVDITIGGLTFRNDGAQTISVVSKKISISNVKVKQTGGGTIKKIINSASINF